MITAQQARTLTKTEVDIDNDYAIRYINRQITLKARRGELYVSINIKKDLILSEEQIEFVVDKLTQTGYTVFMRDRNNQQPVSISHVEQLLIGW